MTQLELPDQFTPAILIPDPNHPLTDEAYFEFCAQNPDVNFERTSDGEIVIVPPAGGQSDYRSAEVVGDLREWAKKDGRGRAFGSSVQFLLPDGSGLSPDAAWVSKERLAALSKRELAQFLRVVPEFVVEVISPSDRLPAAQRKMRRWAANGVELGWLIDGDNRCVHVYRRTAEPEIFANAESINGEGPVEGFVLPLGEIWAGL